MFNIGQSKVKDTLWHVLWCFGLRNKGYITPKVSFIKNCCEFSKIFHYSFHAVVFGGIKFKLASIFLFCFWAISCKIYDKLLLIAWRALFEYLLKKVWLRYSNFDTLIMVIEDVTFSLGICKCLIKHRHMIWGVSWLIKFVVSFKGYTLFCVLQKLIVSINYFISSYLFLFQFILTNFMHWQFLYIFHFLKNCRLVSWVFHIHRLVSISWTVSTIRNNCFVKVFFFFFIMDIVLQ